MTEDNAGQFFSPEILEKCFVDDESKMFRTESQYKMHRWLASQGCVLEATVFQDPFVFGFYQAFGGKFWFRFTENGSVEQLKDFSPSGKERPQGGGVQ